MIQKLCLPAILLISSPLAFSQSDARIDHLLTELGRVRELRETAISPDGQNLAWVVDGEHGGTEIELAPIAEPSKTRRITAGAGNITCMEDSIAWSPNSRSLAFQSDCQAPADNKNQADFFLADVEAKTTPRRLTHLKGIAEAPAFSPDGKELGFLYVEGATRRANPLAAEKPPAGVIGEEGLEIKRVAEVDPATSSLRQITPAKLYVYEFDWSPDSQQIAYVAAPPPGENNWWVAQLFTQSFAEGATPKSILDPANSPGPLHGLQIAVPLWSPDGKQIAFIGGLMSDQGVTGGDIYTLDTQGGQPHQIDISAPSNLTPVWIQWSDQDSIGFSYIAGGSSGYSRVKLSDGVIDQANKFLVPATLGDGRLELSLSFARDGRVAFIESSYAQAPEVWTGRFDGGAGNVPAAITHYNDRLKPSWGKAESVTWTSAVQPSPTIPSGTGPADFNVQGWLLYPAHYDPARKYPLIVYVHGGPSSAVVPRWPYVGFGAVPFSALDCFVLMPNPRGSYGQGEAFTQANRKDFGYGDLRDILAGVDSVTKSHNIDPERVGITGWSYGGYMTMFAVTQTNRFRAAVAGAGIANYQSYYGQNSIDQWMIPFFGASVYDDPAVYARSSPITFIRNVKTPTLVVVGDRDGECPAPQSFEFWHALRAEHVPTELVVYPNEGHHFVDPQHQRDVLTRSLAWFEKYMPQQ